MNKLFLTNSCIDETAATTKRRTFFAVGIVFLLVYMIGSTAASVISTTPLYGYIFKDKEIMDIINSGITDYEEYNTAITSALERLYANMPPWMNAFSLISTVATIIAVMIYCCKIEKRRPFTLGFLRKGAVPEYISGLFIGLFMFSVAYGIAILSGEITFGGFDFQVNIGMIVLFFLGFLVQGASEEILLRGYFFVSGAANSSVAVSVFVSSGLFAAMHLGNPGISFLAIINLFLFGVFAALYFLRRGSIWGICAVHSVWNFAQGNVFGCKVSGMNMGESLFTVNENGGTLWSGGAFGPEGGLCVTVVLVIGITVLTFMKNKNIPEFFVRKDKEFISAY